MTQRTARFAYGVLTSLFLFSCSDGGDQSGSTSTEEEPQTVFTHKMMKQVPGGTPDQKFAYECQSCTFEQWLSIEPPPGWEAGPAQVSLMDSGNLRSRPSFEKIQEELADLQEEDFYDSWDFLQDGCARACQSGSCRKLGLVIENESCATLVLFYIGKKEK